jgi:hypothetical protein
LSKTVDHLPRTDNATESLPVLEGDLGRETETPHGLSLACLVIVELTSIAKPVYTN